MFTFLIYYLQTLVACGCLEAQMPPFGNISSEELDEIYSQEITLQDTTLQISQQDLAARLDRMESQQAAQARQLEALQETLDRIDKKIIPPRFELIGSRFLNIENNIWLNWTTASRTCRQRGGHLASFRGDDLTAVNMKVDPYSFYWVTLAPNNYSAETCLCLNEEEIDDKRCSDFANFICEAENTNE